jgi:nucleoside-diphosphate-sugar epimerase
MRILVTGAAGFVGRAIVDRLAADGGTRLIAAARSWTDEDDRENVARVGFDIAEPATEELVRRIGAVGAVVNAAGLAHRFGGALPEEYLRVNEEGARNAARLAVGLGAARFVQISSVAVYGRGAEWADESSECRPLGVYAESKLKGEAAVREELAGRVRLSVLRPATVVGPGNPGNITRLITTIIKRRFVMVGSGSNFKTFIAVGDVARAADILARAEPPVEGTFNIAAEPVRVAEVVGAIRAAAGMGTARVRLPAFPFLAAAAAAAPLARRFPRFGIMSETLSKWLSDERYNRSAIRAATGFEAEIDVLEEIARQTRALVGTI